jgi:hypothetical protein
MDHDAFELLHAKVFADIARAANDGRHYAALWPLMISVWKRKPV